MISYEILIQAIGGIGLFLVGMIVMTEGLRNLAGRTMRSALMKFTRNPLSGAATGAASTAILQSSSATTVAAVGFVGAELITFPAALGIIFGANIGTTFKGWLIAILGFKLNLLNFFMPLVFAGAVMRLFSKGRLAVIGYTLSGFGIIFIGIYILQNSMSEMHNLISFSNLPADNISGRLLIVGIGLLFSAITQSSSAGVVASLTALYSGIINFNQAACLVIGMDIGTTVTAAMATLGGSVGAKRTGYSHVIYNFLTATMALVILNPYTWAIEYYMPGQLVNNAEILLVAFHTLFNTLGVIIVLPFTSHFAHLMEKIVPYKTSGYTQKLDRELLEDPNLAISAVISSIKIVSVDLFSLILSILGKPRNSKDVNIAKLNIAITEIENYVDKIELSHVDKGNVESILNIVHTLDHLNRLQERCETEENRAAVIRQSPELVEERNLFANKLKYIVDEININRWDKASVFANDVAEEIHSRVHPLRDNVMVQVVEGKYDSISGKENLEAIRWLRRVSKHISRINSHMNIAVTAIGNNWKFEKIKI